MFPIEKLQQSPTPLYYYDLELLQKTLQAIKEAIPDDRFKVHYAIKACNNPQVLKVIADAGFGADCVSGGEIVQALEAGIAPEKIVYAGVGKTDAEILLGLENGIGCFNVESLEELEVLNELALKAGKVAPIAFRINPNIDAHTHEYITTGLAENKFGIPHHLEKEAIKKAKEMKGVRLKGLHFHIGSQITINEPFALLSHRVNSMQDEYAKQGVTFETINVGGGLGIDYDDPDGNPIPDFKSYFATFARDLKLRPGQELHFELGRAVVGQCGSLITRVLYVKKGAGKQFVICDAGFPDLIRPALYGAHHKIENLSAAGRATVNDGSKDTTAVYDVVGPICESTDCFGKDERLPITYRGDLLALRSAGAYGEAMASAYNSRPLPSSLLA
ncbi:MAG: diaminopimelate decarboxylase [Bacteroidales bacterium]|nr:diaminopimelate decarboxylase [Bacteroidales bacterium]